MASANVLSLIISTIHAAGSAALDGQHRQPIECGDRVRFRPKPNLADCEAAIAMIDQLFVIEPALQAVSLGRDLQRVPPTKRWWLDGGRREHPPASVVAVEPEIIFERIGADHIVAALREPEHDTPRCILAA